MSLLFPGLKVWALCRAGDPPAAVVRRLSLLVCSYLAFWIGALSKAGIRTVFFRVWYVALVAFAIGIHLSAAAGMVVIFFEAVCTTGFFGYYLAVHKFRMNSAARRRTPRTDTFGLLQPEQEMAADEREKKLDSSAPTPPPALASPEQSPA